MTPGRWTSVALVLVVSAVGIAWAQRDLAAELIGTWQGTQQQIATDRSGETTSRERTLVVRSVKRSGEGWAVDATFGVTGEKPTRFRGSAARLVESGSDVTLTLTYPSDTYVSLRLAGKDWLEGKHHSRGRGTERELSLKRVSPSTKKQE